MVFFFTSQHGYTIYMGKDKFENEELLKLGWDTDYWFHVDNYSSAHVYLRIPDGQTISSVPVEDIEECAQLVKENSIKGCKLDNIKICYTPLTNIKKTGDMAIGQVSFHSEDKVKHMRVETKKSEIIKRINKTKIERTTDDMKKDTRDRILELRDKKKAQMEAEKKEIEQKRKEKQAQDAVRNYQGVMDDESKMAMLNTSGVTVEEYEDDFM